MLDLIINAEEVYDEETKTFSTQGGEVLSLEHSLVSLSKWESKFKKPFLSGGAKTSEEILEYIRFMINTPGVSPEIFLKFKDEHFTKVQEYIDSSESATTFGVMPERKARGEVITSELIYFWLVNYNIPWEAQYWHLNRLFALIRICNVKTSKPKKMPRNDIARQNRELNEQRKAKLGTSG